MDGWTEKEAGKTPGGRWGEEGARRAGSNGSTDGQSWDRATGERVPSHLGDRASVGLVVIELFLHRQRVLHRTNGSH